MTKKPAELTMTEKPTLSKMPDNSISILCRETWDWNSGVLCRLKFHQDGTGDLLLEGDQRGWIAAEFDWKLLGIGTATSWSYWDLIGLGSTETKTQLMLEMTLTTRHVRDPWYQQWYDRCKLNEFHLHDLAFDLRRFVVMLETGRFVSQDDKAIKMGTKRMFKYRLTFNHSPLPGRECWKEPKVASSYGFNFWERTEFCAGRLDT